MAAEITFALTIAVRGEATSYAAGGKHSRSLAVGISKDRIDA